MNTGPGVLYISNYFKDYSLKYTSDIFKVFMVYLNAYLNKLVVSLIGRQSSR